MSEAEKTPLIADPATPSTSRQPLPTKTLHIAKKIQYSENNHIINGHPSDLQDERLVAGSTPLLYVSIFACVVGTSLQFGLGIGSLNTPATVIEHEYNTSFNDTQGAKSVMSENTLTLLWSITVSIYCVGGLISGAFGGSAAHRFGRKGLMLWSNILVVIAAALMFSSKFCKLYEIIIVGRFVQGLHSGLATVVCPLYLNEISPKHLKGATGTVNQLIITVAMLLAQILGLPQLLGSPKLFYYILALPVIPAAVQCIVLPWCPESPSWLYLVKRDPNAARKALHQLRTDFVEAEMNHLEEEDRELAAEPKVKFKDMFTTYRKRPLLIAVIMHCSQQLSGINAVIFYSTLIFESAKLSHSEAEYATLGVAAIQVLMTFISMLIVEKLGRRFLHLHGLGIMFCALSLLSACLYLEAVASWISYGSIAAIALFIVAFSIGPGPIPWFYTSELFDHSSRSWAISISTVTNWLCNFLVGLLFPTLRNALGNAVFIVFMVLIAIFWTYLYFRAPETKGQTVIQITSKFRTIQSILNLPAAERKQYQTFT